jgi:hypothetical protein
VLFKFNGENCARSLETQPYRGPEKWSNSLNLSKPFVKLL